MGGPVEGTGEGRRPRRAAWWLVALALVAGVALGRWNTGSPAIAADPSPDATATRAAELRELDALRTEVAQPAVCTPAPTQPPTATPTQEPTATLVPAVAAGETVPYGDVWNVTVESVQLVSPPAGLAVDGQLIKVIVTIKNRTDKPHAPPFNDWRLVDAAGNRYVVSSGATKVSGTRNYGLAITANGSERIELVFEVDPASGTAFTLESTEEPAFRVALAISTVNG